MAKKLSSILNAKRLGLPSPFAAFNHTHPPDYPPAVADITERDALPADQRYEGVIIYVESDQTTYQLRGGITNAFWTVLVTATGVSSHNELGDIGTTSHVDIDTHIADATIHFTQAAISITESQISDLQSYALASHDHDADYLAIAGVAVSADALESATTTIDVSAADAPTIGQVLTATGSSAASWQTPAAAGSGDIVQTGSPGDTFIGYFTADKNLSGDAGLTWITAATRLNIIGTTPVFRLQDSNSTGVTMTPVIEFYDNVPSLIGEIGYASGNLFLKNTVGDIVLNTDGSATVVISGDGNIAVGGYIDGYAGSPVDGDFLTWVTGNSRAEFVTPTIISATGTPVDDQIAVFDSANSVEGDPNFLWDQTVFTAGGLVFDNANDQLLIGEADQTNAGISIDGSATATPFINLQQDGVTRAVFRFSDSADRVELSSTADEIALRPGNVDTLIITQALSTFTSAVIVTGNFNSPGIDDNATGERFELADLLAQFGTAGADYTISHAANDRSLTYSGGSASNLGANIVMFGGATASNGDMQLRNDANTFLYWSENNGTLQISTGIGSKSITFNLSSSFLDLGITNTAFAVVHSDSDQILTFSGGTTAILGANIDFHGQSETDALDMVFSASGDTWMQWDESAGTWTLGTGSGVKVDALIIDGNRNFIFGTADDSGTITFRNRDVAGGGALLILEASGANPDLSIENLIGSFVVTTGSGLSLRLDEVNDAEFYGEIQAFASSTSKSSINIPEGVAPTSPNDGDVWVTAAGEFFARLDGVSVDLAGGGGGGDVTKVGTPVDNEIGVWTGDGTLEGNTNFKWNSDATTTDQMEISAISGLTSGFLLDIVSNLSGKTGSVIRILQNHASSSADAFEIQQNSTDTSASIFEFLHTGDSSTPYAGRIRTSGIFSGAVLNLHHDNASSTGVVLFIDQDGSGRAIEVVGGNEVNFNDVYAFVGSSTATLTLGDGSTGTNQIRANDDQHLVLKAGTVDSSGVPLQISLVGGDGGTGTIDGGNVQLTGGPGGDTSGDGGAVRLLGGGPGADGDGGDIILIGGAGTVNGLGGAIDITAGVGGFDGTGGPVDITGGAGISNESGGAVTIKGGAGNGTGDGGDMVLNAGVGGSNGDGGAAELRAGNGSGTAGKGGQILIRAGNSLGGDNAGGAIIISSGNGFGGLSGGQINITAGNSGLTGIGGLVTIKAGNGGATSGSGGDFDIAAGDSLQPVGVGGDMTIKAGKSTGAVSAGRVFIIGGDPGTAGGGNVSILATDAGSLGGTGGAINITSGDGGVTSGDGGDITLTPGTGDADGEVIVVGLFSSLGIDDNASETKLTIEDSTIVMAITESVTIGNGVASNILLKINTGATGNPIVQWEQDSNIKAFIQYIDSGDIFSVDADGAIELSPFNTLRVSALATGIDITGDMLMAEQSAATDPTAAHGRWWVKDDAPNIPMFTDDTDVDYGIVISDIPLKIKIIDIGDWDMDADSSVSVAHGLTLADIRSISVIIRSDDDSTHADLGVLLDSESSTSGVIALSSDIDIFRSAGGAFDSTDFDSTSFNRGWITIHYV